MKPYIKFFVGQLPSGNIARNGANKMTFQDVTSAITAAVAVYGLGAWRAQTAGKRKLELAEEALILFYEAADAIKHVRAPFAFQSEEGDIERRRNEPDRKFDARKRVSVVFTRQQRYSELFSKLRAMRYKFKAVFGTGSGTPFVRLDDILHNINLASQMLAHLWGLDDFEIRDDDRHRTECDKYESIFWQASEDDDVAKQVAAMLAEVEQICRPVLAPPALNVRISLWFAQFRDWLERALPGKI
ncbi:hypothetical protein VSR34_12420 [Paraburkholderia sp. JHI2823]|uniref:hypothetical protein n=1 Tax=Paraburkholderia sp. JHI2823 TaxID=3112960 RepID=UPI003180F45F